MRIIYIVLTFLLAACNGSEKKSFQVQHAGALKNMMHKGDLSAKISLQELQDKEQLYALGAVEELKGEILVLNSNSYVSSVVTDSLAMDSVLPEGAKVLMMDHSFEKNACLLVYTTVEEWEAFAIPSGLTYEEFELFVEKKAMDFGINTEAPFPFLIEGVARSFDWHVIDWPAGDDEHTHEKHIRSGMYGTLENQMVEMLGFYSKHHHAVFTHHTTNMHIHVKTNELAGHVDDMQLGEDMLLKLPK